LFLEAQALLLCTLPLLFKSLALTLTLHKLPTTLVAEFVATTAAHVVAPLVLFNKEFASRTLFEFGAFHEIFEFFIVFVSLVRYNKFFAGLPFVKFDTASKAVVFLAHKAEKTRLVSL
jgi:hypothetical protein